MPDIVVHHCAGEKVLESLDTEISSYLDQDIFCFALMVPDFYSFYRFFARSFRNDIHKRSIVILTSYCLLLQNTYPIYFDIIIFV